jgi:tripartite-type tricarboxylate transporter receptor subunit TctC
MRSPTSFGSGRRTFLRLLGAGVFAAAAPLSARASEPYPSRVVKLVVPYAPGGSTDVMARLIAVDMAKTLNTSVIIENRPGANGFIGANFVGKSPPDGYTLAVLPAVLALTMPVLKPDLPFANELVAVSLIQTNDQILVGRLDLPASTLPEIVAMAKAAPGKVTYGHTGVGTGNHMLAAVMGYASGIEITLAPYRGEQPALNDVMGGHLDLAVSSVAAVGPLIEEKKVKPIAALGPKRIRRFPDVPTASESGYPGFNGNSFLGLHAPTGTPDEILEKLSDAVDAALKVPEIRERILTLGGEPGGGGRKAYAQFLQNERVRVDKIIKQANIKYEE